MKIKALLLFVLLFFTNNAVNSQTIIFQENFEGIVNGGRGTWQGTNFGTLAYYPYNHFYVQADCNANRIAGTRSMQVTGVTSDTTATCNYQNINPFNNPGYVPLIYHQVNSNGYTDVTLSYKWKCNGEENYDYGQLLYSLDGINWTIITDNIRNGNNTTQVVTDFLLPSAVANTTFYIGWSFVADFSTINQVGLTIDDIEIKGYNCPIPTNLEATNVTGNSADLSWTSSESNFDIQWGLQDFVLGTGTVVTGASNPYPLGGLTPNTNYEFYVRANCGGGNYSAWAGPFFFRTTCGSIIDDFPYTETFEVDSELLSCWVVHGYTTLTTWSLATGNQGGTVTSAHNGELNALYFTGSNTGFPSHLASPRMDISELTQPSVSFWYSNQSWLGDIDELRVYYKTSYGAPWTLIPGAIYTSQHSTWTYVELSLPNPSDEYYVSFEGTGNWGHGVTLDDVTFYDAAAECKYVDTYLADGTWSYANPATSHNNKKVVVKGNLIINSNDEFCSLEVRPEGNILINSNLAVRNKISNYALESDFIVESDANLLQINPAENTGQITVKRSAEVPFNQYNFWSSPVAGQNMYSIYPNIPNNRVMKYNTETDFYTILANPANSEFGKGYSIKGPSSGGPAVTSEFIGIPHNETLTGFDSIPLVSGVGQGFNLIGNPYPSNLNLQELYDYGGNDTNIDPTFYFWDNVGNTAYTQEGPDYDGINFATYNANFEDGTEASGGSGKKPNGIVKPGQGFIVQAIAGSGIQINNTMRTTALKINPSDDDAPYYKNGLIGEFDSQRPMEGKFWLELVNPNNLHIQIALGYFEQADHAFDKYDTPVVNESASDNLYSFSTDAEKLTINGRGPFTVEDVIPLGVGFYVHDRYRIQLEDTKGIFVNHQNIYLKDKYLNLIHNLSSSPYEFESLAGEFTDRFEVVFKREGFTNPAIENQISIARQGSNILVSSSLDNIVQVELFNLAGWQVYKNHSVNSKEILIPATSFDNQIIVVTVLTEKGEKVSQKLVNK